jgi:PAS domain S-box-containing protein
MIAILDDQGTFTYCSQSSQRILGYSSTWLLGHRLIDFLQSEDAEKFEEFFARVGQSTGATLTEEVQIRHADDTWLTCEVICNNMKSDPAIGGIVVNLRDISERKRVIDELRKAKTMAEQSSRIKSEFLAAMSHELRTPLNAVIGFSEVIKSGMLGNEAGPRCVDYATHIHDSARHLLRVINNILDLSKAESGQMELAEDYCRLPDIIADCVQLHAPQAAAGGLVVNVTPATHLPYFYGDKRRIHQAIASILSNAVKFTKPGGRVEIMATVDEAGFVVIIRDTGIGMAPDEISVALEPFRQLDARLNRRYEGTGLGLPLTKHLIELHGGVLQIDSAPGEGTRVSLCFPAERVVWANEEKSARRAVR